MTETHYAIHEGILYLVEDNEVLEFKLVNDKIVSEFP